MIEYLGREIKKITLIDDEKLRFDLSYGAFILYDAGQSCCEERWLTCDDDLKEFVGHELRGIEQLQHVTVRSEDGDTGEQLFIRIITDKGSFRFCSHNRHNGYYGGFDISCKAVEV